MTAQPTNPRAHAAQTTTTSKGKTPSANLLRDSDASPSQAKSTRKKPGGTAGTADKIPEATLKISVLIVDDHPLFRSGLRGLLELDEAIQVIGEAQDGQQALDMARALKPQVILMDVNLPL